VPVARTTTIVDAIVHAVVIVITTAIITVAVISIIFIIIFVIIADLPWVAPMEGTCHWRHHRGDLGR
jgi:hypothetical protein